MVCLIGLRSHSRGAPTQQLPSPRAWAESTGGNRDHQDNRPRWIKLRPSHPRDDRNGGTSRETYELATWKCHGVLPLRGPHSRETTTGA
jgi:hypothetical protein